MTSTRFPSRPRTAADARPPRPAPTTITSYDLVPVALTLSTLRYRFVARASVRHDRKNERRRMFSVVEDGLASRPKLVGPVGAQRCPGVRVPSEPRERAAGHEQAHAVARDEDVARRREVDRA